LLSYLCVTRRSAPKSRTSLRRVARAAEPHDAVWSKWTGFSGQPPQAFKVLLPAGVDLLVLNEAALELTGRVALHGRLLFEADRPTRVAWEATTRKIYLDELPRITRAHKEFAEAVRRGR